MSETIAGIKIPDRKAGQRMLWKSCCQLAVKWSAPLGPDSLRLVI